MFITSKSEITYPNISVYLHLESWILFSIKLDAIQQQILKESLGDIKICVSLKIPQGEDVLLEV